jgi:phosphopantothenoylcysteine synthetase/decarboxylase
MAAEPPISPKAADPGAAPSGRRVVVALTGGIACYKTATLVSRLAQRGDAVRVLMTEPATRFVAPLTLQSLSGQRVLTSIWDTAPDADHPESQHVGLARWCQAMVIAPATASTLARLAHGLADDIVSLVACALPRRDDGSLATPLLVAPAMNADMWANPLLQRNVATVRDTLGATIVGPAEGWQACRTAGPGRMVEPETILDALTVALQ